MRLCEWVVTLPVDMFDHKEWQEESRICDYAIYYVKEDVAEDYCIPSVWNAWVCGEENALGEIPVCVTRLSNDKR